MEARAAGTLVRGDLDTLFEALRSQGFAVVGPTVRDGAIVLDALRSSADLPIGWTDDQDGGSYRLRRRDDEAVFGFASGPVSAKRFLFPPVAPLLTARRENGTFAVEEPAEPQERLALVGLHACDLAAIAVQDRVLVGGRFVDASYAARRARLFTVAVNCTRSAATCFCASLGTGPRAEAGYDLALTELLEPAHRFLVEVGSDAGAELAAVLPLAAVTELDLRAALEATDAAAAAQTRRLETDGLHDALLGSPDDPHWDDVASRCLACGNCTLVCPTCFCTDVEDVTDLAGDTAERRRVWASCFSVEYSHMHGGAVRTSARSRYRQWLTHKLATWEDQFGMLGCVGCGRCITWCPVGIDLTAEARALREKEDVHAHA